MEEAYHMGRRKRFVGALGDDVPGRRKWILGLDDDADVRIGAPV